MNSDRSKPAREHRTRAGDHDALHLLVARERVERVADRVAAARPTSALRFSGRFRVSTACAVVALDEEIGHSSDCARSMKRSRTTTTRVMRPAATRPRASVTDDAEREPPALDAFERRLGRHLRSRPAWARGARAAPRSRRTSCRARARRRARRRSPARPARRAGASRARARRRCRSRARCHPLRPSA